jgi:hypothetical protein
MVSPTTQILFNARAEKIAKRRIYSSFKAKGGFIQAMYKTNELVTITYFSDNKILKNLT